MLKFSRGNAKLDALELIVGGQVWTFSQLSGHTCPFARDCFAKVIETDEGRRVVDGKDIQFRCFSASTEVLFPAVYNARKHNTDLIAEAGTESKATKLILASLPGEAKCIRIHVGGDFHKQWYFDAWLNVAEIHNDITFYAYTKANNFWIKRMDNIPTNMVLTASRGGKLDCLIDEHGLRQAVVVHSEAEAYELGLPIDHDDSHAALPELRNESFALLIHGKQPKGSKASKAVNILNGVGSYSRK